MQGPVFYCALLIGIWWHAAFSFLCGLVDTLLVPLFLINNSLPGQRLHFQPLFAWAKLMTNSPRGKYLVLVSSPPSVSRLRNLDFAGALSCF